MTNLLPARTSQGLSSWFGRDPFTTLREEVNDVLGRFSSEGNGDSWLTGPWVPSLDISETDGEIEIKMDAPGVKPEEIDIEVRADVLHIKGEHKEEKEEKGKTYHRIERRTGSFSRSVSLPCAVNEEKVTAECHDGILTICLPKSEESKMKKITVKG